MWRWRRRRQRLVKRTANRGCEGNPHHQYGQMRDTVVNEEIPTGFPSLKIYRAKPFVICHKSHTLHSNKEKNGSSFSSEHLLVIVLLVVIAFCGCIGGGRGRDRTGRHRTMSSPGKVCHRMQILTTDERVSHRRSGTLIWILIAHNGGEDGPKTGKQKTGKGYGSDLALVIILIRKVAAYLQRTETETSSDGLPGKLPSAKRRAENCLDSRPLNPHPIPFLIPDNGNFTVPPTFVVYCEKYGFDFRFLILILGRHRHRGFATSPSNLNQHQLPAACCDCHTGPLMIIVMMPPPCNSLPLPRPLDTPAKWELSSSVLQYGKLVPFLFNFSNLNRTNQLLDRRTVISFFLHTHHCLGHVSFSSWFPLKECVRRSQK